MRLWVLIAVTGVALLPAAAHAEPAWELRLYLPDGYISDLAPVSDNTAWAAGPGGIFRSEDAGRSWTFTTPGLGSFYGIAPSPSGERGWAVGPLGQIAATTDGGRTWSAQTSGTDINLSLVAAIDESTAIAGGSGTGFSDVIIEPLPSVLLITRDGGATWGELRITGEYRPRSMDALGDGLHAWISGERCVPQPEGFGCVERTYGLLFTDDGGRSWGVMDGIGPFIDLQFVDKDQGWAQAFRCDANYACGQTVERTEDGGRTWTVVRGSTTPQAGTGIGALSALDPETAVVAEYTCVDIDCATSMLITDDGGASWRAQAPPSAGNPVDHLAMWDETRGVRGFFKGLQYTANGRDWAAVAFPPTTGSGQFDMVDVGTGWVAASKLLSTRDGGRTWAVVSDRAFADIDFVSPMLGWAIDFTCSAGGCGGGIERTDDGGKTWQRQFPLGNLGDFPRIHAQDELNVWVIARYDRLLFRTRDGGQTWTQHALPPGESQNFVWLSQSGGVGWAAESVCGPGFADCRIVPYRSLDGGATWSPLAPIPERDGCGIRDALALGSTRVWLIGAECRDRNMPILYRSRDGGATWESLPFGFVGDVRGLTFFDGLTGRAIAAICDPEDFQAPCGQYLLRTQNGGQTWSRQLAGLGPNFGVSEAQFLAPELVWLTDVRGAGLMDPSSYSYYVYEGGPPLSRIIAPDTGSGGLPRSGAQWGVIAIASAAASLLIASLVARNVMRRAR